MIGYEDFLKNDNENKPKIGDTVAMFGQCDEIYFTGQIGTITFIELNFDRSEEYYLIKFKIRFNDNLHDADERDPTNSSYWAKRYNFIYGEKNIEEFIEKREQETKKNKHLDPFGEEDWLF
jgi:hypothetical protein